MGKINPQALQKINFLANGDVHMILDQAAIDTLLFSRVDIMPEFIFLAFFEAIDDLNDDTAKTILRRILDTFDSTTTVSNVIQQLDGKTLSARELKLASLRLCIAQVVGARFNSISMNLKHAPISKDEKVGLTPEAIRTLQGAQVLAKSERNNVTAQPFDLLRAILSDANISSQLKQAIKMIGTTHQDIAFAIQRGLAEAAAKEALLKKAKPAFAAAGPDDVSRPKSLIGKLDEYGTNLSELARKGELSPLIGREKELDELVEILHQRNMPNCIIIGEPGVGKTAMAKGLAQLIEAGQVPDRLRLTQIFSLNTNSMVAGTSLRGMFEDRLDSLIKIAEKDPNLLIFVDEIHELIKAGRASGAEGAGQPLKSAISENRIRIIGATTEDEYRKHIASDPAFAERFTALRIKEPDEDMTRQIMLGIKGEYETHHNVTITDECIDTIIAAVRNYASGHSPRREIQILGRTCAAAEVSGRQEITGDMALCKIAQLSGIPANQLTADTLGRINFTEQALHERIIGQNEAIAAIMSGLRRSVVGLRDKKKPIYTALFAGSSGVGKTEVCRQIAEYYFPAEDDFIRFDMSEYMEKHSVSRLVGSPPGYIGSDEGGQLVNKVRSKPYCVLLFDEVEKAHPDVLNILLQIFEEGVLTDAKGNIAHFNNAIVILTTNVGSSVSSAKPIGFGSSDAAALAASRKELFDKAIKQQFRPELLGRIDDVVVFNQLAYDDYIQIVDLELKELTERLYDATGIIVHPDDEVAVCEKIAKAATSDSYGARGIKSYIKRHIETPLSEYILISGLGSGDMIKIIASDSPDDIYLLEVVGPAGAEL
ncbi:ATP-dependent Clp protease ATP-binding subunit [Candidatus Saccharibacteria bacterium]|nr:ATP-dependent Clp protease ATP-binding subunit [Candidatus Saccharibacteria bacterium]